MPRLILTDEHKQILRDRTSWYWDNPFLLREVRRDRKRDQPLLSIFWMSLFVALFVGTTLWLLFEFAGDRHANSFFLGGNVITLICAVTATVHSMYISGAALKHSLRILAQETSTNTLPGILTLPNPPFKLVLQASAYAFVSAMRQAFLLFPVYMPPNPTYSI